MVLETFSADDILQKYLISQSKFSSLVQKPKQKIISTKSEQKKNVETKTSIKYNKESGSEYFPSTDSGKKKKLDIVNYYQT